MCQSGLVHLKKRLKIEKNNFYPRDGESYEQRQLTKTISRTLGCVQPKQYFGVKEGLMSLTALQVPCPLAVAAEDTTLIFFKKTDLVDAFDKDQIRGLLD